MKRTRLCRVFFLGIANHLAIYMIQNVIKYNTLDRNVVPEDFLHQERNPVHLVLDNIRSAFNVGSAFRTGDATRVEKIHLGGISAAPPNSKLEKTALNSTQVVPWQYYHKTTEAIQELKKNQVTICAVELTSASVDFWEYSFPKPVALVFGHEVLGVGEDVLQMADTCLYIPMYGKKTTINVSTALGVVLFEVLRQWKSLESPKLDKHFHEAIPGI